MAKRKRIGALIAGLVLVLSSALVSSTLVEPRAELRPADKPITIPADI